MKSYYAERGNKGVEVVVLDRDHPGGGYILDPRFDLKNHSPSGFEFGFSGSGPAQLALALLADALGSDERALRNYQRFKSRVLAPMEGDTFEFSEEDIRQIVSRIEAERGSGVGR